MNEITSRERAQHVAQHLVTAIGNEMGWTPGIDPNAYAAYIASELRLDIKDFTVTLITFFDQWEQRQQPDDAADGGAE